MSNRIWNGLKPEHKSWLAAVAVVLVVLGFLVVYALSTDPFVYSLF